MVAFNLGCYCLIYVNCNLEDIRIVLFGVGIGIIDSYMYFRSLGYYKSTDRQKYYQLLSRCPRKENVWSWFYLLMTEWLRNAPLTLFCCIIAAHYGELNTFIIVVSAVTVRQLVARTICGVWLTSNL